MPCIGTTISIYYNKLQKNSSKIHSYEKKILGEKKHLIFFYSNHVGSLYLVCTPFVFLERTKRQDGVIAKTKRLMTLWWTTKMQISPNKKDVTHVSASNDINMNFMQHTTY